MMNSGFTPLPASGLRRVNFFERRSRSSGGSSRSYSEQFSGPAHARAERRLFWQLVALTVLLPPVGTVVMWRFGMLRVKPRIAVTLLAFALTVLYMFWIIPKAEPEIYQPTIVRPSAVTEYSPSAAADDGAT